MRNFYLHFGIFLFLKIYYHFHVCECLCLHGCQYNTCMPGAQGGQKKPSAPWERTGVTDRSWVVLCPLKEQPVLLTSTPSLLPHTFLTQGSHSLCSPGSLRIYRLCPASTSQALGSQAWLKHLCPILHSMKYIWYIASTWQAFDRWVRMKGCTLYRCVRHASILAIPRTARLLQTDKNDPQCKTAMIPNNSWLESSKSLFYFFSMIALLEALAAGLATGIHVLFPLLTDPSSIPRLKHDDVWKERYQAP